MFAGCLWALSGEKRLFPKMRCKVLSLLKDASIGPLLQFITYDEWLFISPYGIIDEFSFYCMYALNVCGKTGEWPHCEKLIIIF